MNLKKNGFLFYGIRKTVYQENRKTIQSHKMIGKENSFIFSMKLGCHLTLTVTKLDFFKKVSFWIFGLEVFQVLWKIDAWNLSDFFGVKLEDCQFHRLGVMLADFQLFINLLFQKIKRSETWLSCHYSQIIRMSLSTVCCLLHLDFGNPDLENHFLWLKIQMAFKSRVSIINSRAK